MSVIVVDTSTWISYFKNMESTESTEITEALQESRCLLSPVVASELLSAKLKATEHAQLIEFLNALEWVSTSQEHWFRVGDLRRNLSQKGIHLSTPDAHIAQCALDRNAVLFSEDKIFELIKKHTVLKLNRFS